MAEVKEIPVEDILVGEHNVRMDEEDDGIADLAVSIDRVGVIVPLLLSREADALKLVSGHRRLLAAKRVRLSTVPCIVQSDVQHKASEISFAENFFRRDLSPVELAGAIKDCLDKEDMTVSGIALGFHRTEHWVRSMLSICDWPDDVQRAIHEGHISVSAGSNLAMVVDDAYRGFLVKNAVEQGATARTTAAWLQAWRSMQPPEEAVTAEPVEGVRAPVPQVPQAPCLCCAVTLPVDRMSHVPICGDCVKVIRRVGMSVG